jgi:hypothetical protein
MVLAANTTPQPRKFGIGAILLIAANALPLVGIVLWGWDAFEILVLYWFETAIIGFWTLFRLAAFMLAPENSTATGWRRLLAPTAVGLFFTLHAGIFMLVHFMFLWLLFSGDWASRINGPRSFVSVLIIGAGLWVPLLALFIVRGLMTLYALYGDRLMRPRSSGTRQTLRPMPRPAATVEPTEGNAIGGFYRRIIIMHVAILAGGFLAMLGSIVPLIVLVVVKTVIDLRLSREN